MEIILLSIIIIVLITILLIVLLRKNNNNDMVERMGKLETGLIKEFADFRSNFSRDLSKDFDKLNEKIDYRLNYINERVQQRLDSNFAETNKTFSSILERLSKIDEAQKKIDSLSTNIVSLQDVLTDKKARGTFGEINLKNIMASVFGEKNDQIYQMQYTFNNNKVVDCVLFAPSPLGIVAIDSKFPLENYRKMVESKGDEKKELQKKFKNDLKTHIDAIASKYIITNETSDQAIMFIPAEAIYAEMYAYHEDIVEYAYKKRVWVASPTTLMSTLTTVQIVLKNIERDKYANIIYQELNILDAEFKRYKERWDKLSRSIDSVTRDVKEIHTTTDKITKKFDSISRVEIEKPLKGEEND